MRQLQGRTMEALQLYAQALEVDPSSARALLRQGACHLRLGDLDAAVRSLRRNSHLQQEKGRKAAIPRSTEHWEPACRPVRWIRQVRCVRGG